VSVHVAAVLRQNALRHPERVALVDLDRGERVTYGALDARAGGVAAALRAAGVRPGDRVGLLAENSPAMVAAWFGVLYAGAAVVPVPVVAAPRELAFRMGHSRAKALLADSAQSELAAHAGVPVRALEDLAEGDPEVDDAPADQAMILYTSGTTGAPKGAVIGHASLATHTAALVHHTLRLDARDAVLGVLPFSHSYGIRMAVLAPFYAGARSCCMRRFDPTRSLAAARDEEVSWLPGVPTMFAAGAEAPGEPWGALRWCLSAGAPLADDVRRRAERRLGAEIREGYGLTEATFTCIDAPPSEGRPGSVGPPVWGVEVRVGEGGELFVRGQNVMLGYLDDPDATASVIRDGWLRTGDVGEIDGEGRVRVVDRLKDMILRGGHNVVPAEVEAALLEHPAVTGAAVVGRDHPRLGEEVVAVLVARDVTVAELDAFVRERVAKTGVPREVAFVDALPLGPSRKVLRRVLRAQIESGELSTQRVR